MEEIRIKGGVTGAGECLLSPSDRGEVRPGLLSSEDQKALRSMEEIWSLQSGQLSAIAEAYEERLAIATMPRHCRECAAGRLCPEWSFVPKYIAMGECPDDVLPDLADNMLHGEGMRIVSGCLNTLGRRGRSGGNPIDAILWDLQALRGRIMRLSRTELPQTTGIPGNLRSSCRRSDGGTAHVQADIPTDTTGYLRYLGILSGGDNSGFQQDTGFPESRSGQAGAEDCCTSGPAGGGL